LFNFIPNQSHCIGTASDLDLCVELVCHSSCTSRLTFLKLKEKNQCIRGKNGSTEHSKGNKTISGKVATTRTEDEHK